MLSQASDPRMDAFEVKCRDAGTTPEAVLKLANIHGKTWFRWKSGEVSPTLRNWDAANAALETFIGLAQGSAA